MDPVHCSLHLRRRRILFQPTEPPASEPFLYFYNLFSEIFIFRNNPNPILI